MDTTSISQTKLKRKIVKGAICVYVCMYVWAYIYIYTCARVCICICTHTYIHQGCQKNGLSILLLVFGRYSLPFPSMTSPKHSKPNSSSHPSLSYFFSEWGAIAGQLDYHAKLTNQSGGGGCREEARERALDGQDWTLVRNALMGHMDRSLESRPLTLRMILISPFTKNMKQWGVKPTFSMVQPTKLLESVAFFLFLRL